MVWFKVDDKLHSNTKIRKVLADEPAALALWTVAGSWSSDELTDGFIPDSQLPWLYPAGAEQLAQKLVTARLWRRVRGGYQFHEWHADADGTKRNPSAAEVEAERRKKAEAGRIGGLNSAKTRSKKQARASANAAPVASEVLQPPTRPDPPPSKEGGEGSGLSNSVEATAVEAVPWRSQKAFGVTPDPEIAATSRRGAAAARAEIRRPSRFEAKPGADDPIAALDAALSQIKHPEGTAA